MYKKNYDKDIYSMYEEEVAKNEIAKDEIKNLKLEIYVLRTDLRNSENNICNAIEQATKPLIEEKNKLQNELSKAYEEIDRLKNQINKSSDDNKYQLDKLKNQINKNSSNSGIPTSKEIKKVKTGSNTYNHRKKSSLKNGGQFGHKGETLTKEKLLAKIKEKNIPVKQVTHYIKGSSKQKDIVKYKIGTQVNLYVEEHIFKHTEESNDVLPR